MKKNIINNKIAIIGLGYVGLPLALAFGKKFKTIGFDTNIKRINNLSLNLDTNREFTTKEIKSSQKLIFSSDILDLKERNIYIICVPTPIDKKNKPDLRPIKSASSIVGRFLKKGDLVIYESTVYPGLTEEVCVPILQKKSKLKYNNDFFCGYSPERINPGDKKNKLENIVKVVSGSNKKILNKIDKLYKEVIPAGTYKAESIKVAEAAKIIENTQRDLNIALINEISIICKKLKIDINHVLKTAETKWNFLSFKPGLVGGHCISVDPYYLTYKANKLGYKPNVILSGRKINDNMYLSISKEILNISKLKKINIKKSNLLIMGLAFKENCSDIKNSQTLKIINFFKNKLKKIDIFDPYVNDDIYKSDKKISFIKSIKKNSYDIIIIPIIHDKFTKINSKTLQTFAKSKSVIYDVKGYFKKNVVDSSL